VLRALGRLQGDAAEGGRSGESVIPAEPYSEDHDEETLPSGVKNLPPAPAPPAAIRVTPAQRYRLTWAIAWPVATILTGLSIATVLEFLLDLSSYGAPWYAASVVLSSAALGALLASARWWVRGRG